MNQRIQYAIENTRVTAAAYAPFVLRISMAIVYKYFGTSQLRIPESFIGWLPPEVALLPISARSFVILNGAFETFCGLLLLFGIFSRTCALLLGGHLLGITYTIGWTEIGVRDLGLSLATLTIVLLGSGPLGVDDLYQGPRRGSLGEQVSATNQPQQQRP